MSVFVNLAKQLLPVAMRAAARVNGLIEAMLKPLEHGNAKIEAFVADKRYRLRHSGQVYSLENVLNDWFEIAHDDADRIYITDGDDLTDNLLPYDNTGLLMNYSLNIPYDRHVLPQLSLKHGYTNEADFIVHVPAGSGVEETDGNAATITTLVDEYRIAGKRFKVVWDE